MAAGVLKLFDFYWFEHDLFAAKQVSPGVEEEKCYAPEPRSPGTVKFPGRSLSDRSLSYDDSSLEFHDLSSPKSVITTPKLQKIISGEEICEFANEEVLFKKEKAAYKTPPKTKVSNKLRRRRRRRKGVSRSLSELEFEELKGFMDLGFVFTEEDKTSSGLVSIVPGLQRLGKIEKDGEEKINDYECKISRPYLSEAWEFLDQKKARRQLVKWKFPALPDEINMKNHLKVWAQTVASTIR